MIKSKIKEKMLERRKSMKNEEKEKSNQASHRDAPFTVEFAKIVKVDENKGHIEILNKMRQRGKGDKNSMIKKKLRETDQKKDLEKFKQITGQKRLKYAAENGSHLKTSFGLVPLNKFKKEYSNEVPEYLKALVESGMKPEEAFRVANSDSNDPSKKGPDTKAV